MKNYTCPVLSGNRTVQFRAVRSSLLDSLSLWPSSIGSLSTISVLEYSHQEALTTAFFLHGREIACTTGCYC